MKISTNARELRELSACKECYETFVESHGENHATLSQFLESNGWDNVWWLISETIAQFSDQQHHDLLVYSYQRALLNIEEIKPYCSNNHYELILKYLNDPTELANSSEELAAKSAARSAALSSWSAESRWSVMRAYRKDLMSLLLKWESQ